eukprot:9355646-Lingulodinium_polyedra.AAC.1
MLTTTPLIVTTVAMTMMTMIVSHGGSVVVDVYNGMFLMMLAMVPGRMMTMTLMLLAMMA